MKRLLKYFHGYVKYAVIGPIAKLIEAILELIVPLVTAKIIDVGIPNKDIGYIFRMGGMMFLLAACGLAAALICQYFAAKCAYGYSTALRKDMYHHINHFSQTSMEKFGSATLITRLTADTNNVQSGINMMIRLATRCPFLIIGAMIMAMRIDLKLSLILFAAIPIIGYVLYLITSKTIPGYQRNQKLLDKITRHTRENIDGVRVIRAFSRQKEEEQQYAEECEEYAKKSAFVGAVGAFLNPASFLIMNLGIVAVLWCGGYRVNGGHLTQGELVAFVNYMTQIALALVRLAELLATFNKALASAKRVVVVLEEPETLREGMEQADSTANKSALAFRDVSFAYPGGGAPALKHISFALQKGETLGIIGGTGSGKSTVAALLRGVYNPTEGQIEIYGKNAQEYSLSGVSNLFGVAPQHVQLVQGTVRENLLWGNPNTKEETLWKACQIAQAAPFLKEKGEGLELEISQNGKNLSGGQKQRLTIARAIAANRDFLILDDSMSALDYATDLALRKALDQDLADKTKIIISQRASSLQNAEHILVLEEGEMVGYGTHAELLQNCKVYREIYNMQVEG